MQTIAANMGGMITPYGNPQNLYLYYNIPTSEFFGILLVQVITVAVLLYICCSFIKNEKLKLRRNSKIIINRNKLYMYGVLFILVILTIFRVIPYVLTSAIVIITMLIADKKGLDKLIMHYLQHFLCFLYSLVILQEYQQ